ncbi:hypothetical protein PR048_002627 [Dryococelus australis]|uniref:Reverse transcriptase Ty1/copia-type domain-containing protein n=1 Tax=Dryococelus australis TaxID=614101 RepID=A0ABQ9IKU6_9NEOP|nr:hypothetical protein PR048_002627 [Dryococelus australis]
MDCLIVGTASNIVKALEEEFKAKDLGKSKAFLGQNIERKEDAIYISQSGFVQKILKKFRMEDCKSVSTPMETGFQGEDDGKTVEVPYRELVGSLIYFLCSRPDISFAVTQDQKLVHKKTQDGSLAGKRVLRYLKVTQDQKIVHKKTQDGSLHAYSDAAWARDSTDRKSVSGVAVYFCGNLVSWMSKKENVVTLNIAES